jgi:hypothetical protein
MRARPINRGIFESENPACFNSLSAISWGINPLPFTTNGTAASARAETRRIRSLSEKAMAMFIELL